MAEPNARSRWKVFVLAGAALALLAIDVVALAFVIVPLAASTRPAPAGVPERATRTAELALLLPTRDPRTPWPTSTPAPTPTPWLVLPPTPESTHAMAPVDIAPAPQSVTPATLVPATTGAPPPHPALTTATPLPAVRGASSILVTVPTPPQRQTGPAAGGAGEDATPLATAPASTETPEPTEIPTEEVTETPAPPTPPVAPGDEAQFEAYVRDHYNTIGGQPLEVISVTLEINNDGVPGFVVEVAGNDTNNVLASQPAEVLSDYGRRLLDDTKFYFDGQSAAMSVESTLETADGAPCANTPVWCDQVTWEQATDVWTVTWTYVRGSYTEGSDKVEAWNSGQ